jgi:hypothetical protein
MKKHPAISLSGMCRRAVIARFESIYTDAPGIETGTEEEKRDWLRRHEEMSAAIDGDPDVNLGGEIEEALNAALKHAAGRGQNGADALAEAGVTDPKVLEIISRPGAAAVILRQLIGYALLGRNEDDDDDDDDDDDPPIAAILMDSELLRKIQDAEHAATAGAKAPAASA